MEIRDTTAIVTGAASGLGAATAAALVEAGAHVVGIDLQAQVDDAPTREGITFVAADITDPEQVAVAVEQAASFPEPLRTVVSCAGIGPSMRILGKKGPHDLAFYAKVVQVNLLGTFNVMTLAAEKIAGTEALEDGARGVVINTASVAAFDGQVGQAAYASSKGGVVGLTLPAARDLAQHGIRVNTICPGIVETPMLATVSDEFRAGLAAGVPFPARLGRPDEYAELALDLIRHDYMNGETIRMDGALRMAPR
ncbi:MAG: 3-hydroxyacyl-CoA dehydrogenase [Pimelobacter sp.]|nr:3-hydroxyacyl-CoA dehydrogenase [Pimelobacter sp.]